MCRGELDTASAEIISSGGLAEEGKRGGRRVTGEQYGVQLVFSF